ncbi:MAG: hypothetical protein AABZ39_19640 [Spirochaetota bacterium]
MKHFIFLMLCAVMASLAPINAEEKAGKPGKGGEEAPQMDEKTKAEFEAAKKKFDSARAEFEAVMEKVRGSRPEGEKRGDMATLTGQVDMLKQQIALTDEQYKKVKELAEKLQKEIDARTADVKKTMETIDAERAKDAPDFGKLREAFEKRSKIESENMLARFKFPFDAKPLISAEQFAKWKEIMKKMEERMKAGRDKMPGGQKPKGGE